MLRYGSRYFSYFRGKEGEVESAWFYFSLVFETQKFKKWSSLPVPSLVSCAVRMWLLTCGSEDGRQDNHTMVEHMRHSAKVCRKTANQIKSSPPISKQQMKTSTQSVTFDLLHRPETATLESGGPQRSFITGKDTTWCHPTHEELMGLTSL